MSEEGAMVTAVSCETEVLQFGRNYGWVCVCGASTGGRFDTWEDAEASAGEHEEAGRQARRQMRKP